MSRHIWLLTDSDFDWEEVIAASYNPELLKAKAAQRHENVHLKWLEDDDGATVDKPVLPDDPPNGWYRICQVEVLE